MSILKLSNRKTGLCLEFMEEVASGRVTDIVDTFRNFLQINRLESELMLGFQPEDISRAAYDNGLHILLEDIGSPFNQPWIYLGTNIKKDKVAIRAGPEIYDVTREHNHCDRLMDFYGFSLPVMSAAVIKKVSDIKEDSDMKDFLGYMSEFPVIFTQYSSWDPEPKVEVRFEINNPYDLHSLIEKSKGIATAIKNPLNPGYEKTIKVDPNSVMQIYGNPKTGLGASISIETIDGNSFVFDHKKKH